jgi:hypothetical protein
MLKATFSVSKALTFLTQSTSAFEKLKRDGECCKLGTTLQGSKDHEELHQQVQNTTNQFCTSTPTRIIVVPTSSFQEVGRSSKAA